MRLATSVSSRSNGQARSAMAKFWRWQSGGSLAKEERREWQATKDSEFELKDYHVPVSEAAQSPSSDNYYSKAWETHKNPSAVHMSTKSSSGRQLAELVHQWTSHQPAVSSGGAHPVVIHRDWQHASQSTPTPPQESFVITSFNILASAHARKHRSLYSSVPSHLLAWRERRRKILEKLDSCSPDIVCLQEVDQFKNLEQDLVWRGYKGLYKARTGEMPDGCAIFWRKERFQLLQERSFEFSMLGMKNNVAQLCVLELIVPGLKNNNNHSPVFSSKKETQIYRLVVGNIHVLFNPKRGEIKLGQCRAFLEQVHNMSSIWHGAPVVIGGDFNSTPSSAVYEYLATSKLDLSSLDRRHLSGLIPEVPSANLRNVEPCLGRLKEASAELLTAELSSQKMGLQMASSSEGNSMECVGAVHQTNPCASLDPDLEDRNGQSKVGEQILGLREQTSDQRASMAAVLEGATENLDAYAEHTVISLEEPHDINGTHDLTTNEAFGAGIRSLSNSTSCVSQDCAEVRSPNHVQSCSDSSSSSTEGQYEYGCGKCGWDVEELRIATGKPDCTLMQHELNLYSAYSDIQGHVNTRDAKGEPLVTTCHRDFLGTVDYIWRTDGLKTMRVLETVPVKTFEKNKGLPVTVWGSDHLPLVCELAFTQHGS